MVLGICCSCGGDAAIRGGSVGRDGGSEMDAGSSDAGDHGAATGRGRLDAAVVPGADAGRDAAGRPMDAGPLIDAGHRKDAGARVDAGLRVDAGTRVDAGRVIDAGAGLDGGYDSDARAAGRFNCMDDLTVSFSGPDFISVHGHAGTLGAVNYTIGGYSAGVTGGNGTQRFTGNYFGERGMPSGISQTSLYLWTGKTPLLVGQTYEGTNSEGNADPSITTMIFIDFGASADSAVGVGCPRGSGTGRFVFTQFSVTSSSPTLIEGSYEFHCPDAAIDVAGCFHYGY